MAVAVWQSKTHKERRRLKHKRRSPPLGTNATAGETPLPESKRHWPCAQDSPRLLSAQAAAQYLGVPYTSLRDWALRGDIPLVRVPNCRRLWFDKRDLDRAIDAWKERAAR